MSSASGASIAEEELVFSLDVGATQSAIALLHIRKGIDARDAFVVVPRWPGQYEADSKVPSTVCYRNGRAVAFGQEAEAEEGPGIIRNFKLLLHPPEMRHLTERSGHENPTPFEVPELPDGVSIGDVYADYIRFLVSGAKKYFVGTAASLGAGDEATWNRLIGSAHFVLSVPNGWHEPQKALVRSAFRQACPSSGSVHLPSEAEVSLHYLLNAPMQVLQLRDGKVLGVCDAGGSTIDFTIYKVINAELRTFEETSVHCLQKGGLYVSRRVRQHLEDLLEPRRSRTTPESHAGIIDGLVRKFDAELKTKFSSRLELGNQDCRLQLSLDPITDQACSLKRGWLHLKADRVNAAFDSCATPITDQIAKTVMDHNPPLVEEIAIVGGFGESPFIQERLMDSLPQIPMRISPEPGKKAVAAGGVYWWLNRDAVVKRGARYTYGISIHQSFDPTVHGDRRTFEGLGGGTEVKGLFSTIIRQNEVVASDKYRAFSYWWPCSSKDLTDRSLSVALLCYPSDQPPMWDHDEDGNLNPGFRAVATLRSDFTASQLDQLSNLMVKHPVERTSILTETSDQAVDRAFWYALPFDLQVAFGGIDISAYLQYDQSLKGSVEVIPAGW